MWGLIFRTVNTKEDATPLTKARDEGKGQPVRKRMLLEGKGFLGRGVLLSICDSKACFLRELVGDNHPASLHISSDSSE